MECLNCGKDIPDAAKACQFCEAPVEDPPTEEEMQAAAEVFESLGPEGQELLMRAFEGSATAEDFANRLMVGVCPSCDSDNAGDCGDDPEIEHPCIGRCFECGQLWCLDCGELLKKDATDCPHEAICKKCGQDETCEIFPADCPDIQRWQEGKGAE